MQAAIHPIYQAAHQEVIHMQLLLEELAELFSQTFSLSSNEAAALHVRAELHRSGQSIELFVADADVVFSLGIVFDRQSNDHVWELVAFHGTAHMPHWVSTMRVGPTVSDYARRVRGARLVATIGNYLESDNGSHNGSHGDAIGFMRVENNHAWQPQIAAFHELQPA